jgi:hypothetical protein
MELLRFILLFNQTKNEVALFFLPNAELNGSILKYLNGVTLFYLTPQPNQTRL